MGFHPSPAGNQVQVQGCMGHGGGHLSLVHVPGPSKL